MLFRLFLEKNGFVYAAADIISRAERHQCQVMCWKAGNFYSFSNVAEDHQTKNAKAIVEKNGAILLKNLNSIRV
jgi:UDP-N-acetylglucosamine--N-acetylmuramyl-(pentapeptide) pyrophosphoryl-undecaprenol N-acetylglucosamine transferase